MRASGGRLEGGWRAGPRLQRGLDWTDNRRAQTSAIDIYRPLNYGLWGNRYSPAGEIRVLVPIAVTSAGSENKTILHIVACRDDEL